VSSGGKYDNTFQTEKEFWTRTWHEIVTSKKSGPLIFENFELII
jgi:hypothetical protein